MNRKLISAIAITALATAALLLTGNPAQAQRWGGYYRGPYYRPYGYGYYRPYPVIGVGIGVGLYAPYYGSYVYPVAPGYAYSPYPAPVVVSGAPAVAPQVAASPTAPPSAEKPAPDDAAHLQLTVPANAEVWVDGSKMTQSGAVREVLTPKLNAGSRYTYRISVRYTDATGKAVDDTRDIHFHANDWFAIDFTRPAPPPAPTAAPSQLPLQPPAIPVLPK
jgi:uncharacterized protein (TIGR03000 family)